MPALVASIGTTHPWNIAGVGLDARIVAEYGLSHAMAIAAVSAQDERGLHDLHVVPPQALRAQLESLPREIAAFRIGAAGSSENVRVIAAYLRDLALRPPVVVDPVIAVTLGGELSADDDVMETIDEELLPLGIVITPNIAEAAQLAEMQVQSIDDMRIAAKRLVARGACAAYVKGGHLDGDPVDVLVTAQGEDTYIEARLAGAMRGSGCTLAAALACELALGRDLRSAASRARAFVRTRIAAHSMRAGLQVAF
jgi:hydroxymethylpyrimidine/phosphomethylpyrimidine kinase